ncbi:hypothetical protein OIU74_028155 [Salix koriyanagi]|uniref:Uncharacterized protein n=1 Tax=Salix koriyanagi TaxID=2511006 RepID=A0A9Q0VBY8_9ROSI|nr:hypothetical protein OIU74_028155 [Salix koriyanagi]
MKHSSSNCTTTTATSMEAAVTSSTCSSTSSSAPIPSHSDQSSLGNSSSTTMSTTTTNQRLVPLSSQRFSVRLDSVHVIALGENLSVLNLTGRFQCPVVRQNMINPCAWTQALSLEKESRQI